MERPALKPLLELIRSRGIDVIVVYKVDRLTRSLADFAKLVELFDASGVSFVSVTQSRATISGNAIELTLAAGDVIRLPSPRRKSGRQILAAPR
jgi:DNA invertase Pin-like site-specific DNA recombinase